MRKRSFLFFLLALLLVSVSILALGGCDTAAPPVDDDDDENGAPAPDPDPAPAPGLKTITVAFNSVPQTTDPHNHRHRVSQSLARNWTEGLTQTMPDGSQVMDLAVSIDQLDDVTYEIKLRQDVTFHNGDPMTADDVIFSLERLTMDGAMEGETSPRKSLLPPVDTLEKIDDYTIRVTLSSAVDPSRSWYNAEIIPKNYFLEVGVEKFLENPIGCGPFKWVEGDVAGDMILERYENYYGGPDELPGDVDRVPALDRVIFRGIVEPTTRVAALLAGDVDIITHVPVDSVSLLESNPNVQVESQEGTAIKTMFFNTTKAPFDDKRVRQAIAYAIDYDLIVEQLLLGFAQPLKGRPFLIPYADDPNHNDFDDVKSPYDYDPEKAKALLDEAGVTSLVTVIDVLSPDADVGQAISQMLSDIGIDASVRVWEYGVISGEFKAGGRDMFIVGWGNAGRNPTWIRNVASTGGSGNFALYNNPTFDDLIVPANNMLHSPERTAMFIEAFEIILDDLPVLALYNEDVIEASRSHVKNFYPHNAGRLNMHRVDIEQ